MIDQTFPNVDVATIGDFREDIKSGNFIPFETVLTLPIEQCSK